MKKGLSILLLLIVASCTSNTIFDKPDDLIPKDTMVSLLADLYISKSARGYRNNLKERNVDYTYMVYDKYLIDSARFRRSNFYYTTKIDQYEKIYKEVESKLKAMNEALKQSKKTQDSIKRDSIRNSTKNKKIPERKRTDKHLELTK